MFWSLLRALAVLWLLRKLVRLTRTLLGAAVLAVLWPVSLVAGAGWLAAWLTGWPPARLYRAAVRSLPMTAVWLVATAMHAPGWRAVALAPNARRRWPGTAASCRRCW